MKRQVLEPRTEYRDRVRRRRHRFTDAQQEDDERQEDGDLEVGRQEPAGW